MIYFNFILNVLIVCVLTPKCLSQEGGPELVEEYIDDESYPEELAPEEVASTAKPNKTEEVKKTSHFTDDRFSKLFPNRANRPNRPIISPKFISKPKATLPPFIKNTPAIIRVSPTEPSVRQRQSFSQRATAAPLRTTTTRASRNSNNSNRRNQLSNRSQSQTTTSTPASATPDSASRRRFGSGSRRSFSTNATIPSNPRRI